MAMLDKWNIFTSEVLHNMSQSTLGSATLAVGSAVSYTAEKAAQGIAYPFKKIGQLGQYLYNKIKK